MAPSIVQLAAVIHSVFFVGLWAYQALFLGRVSFVHMTVGVFLVVLLLARTKPAWPLCLTYDGLLTASTAYRLYGMGVGWEQKAALGNVLMLFLGILAILTLLWPRMLHFVFTSKKHTKDIS